MWTIITYEPAGLISLKLSTATSTGGKSLLFPTPFAFKMAVLDVILRTEGVERGRAIWPAVRDAQLALHGPERVVVTNTFTKVLRPNRSWKEPDTDTGLIRPMLTSIGFREYVLWQGPLRVAFRAGQGALGEWPRWLSMISYIGKRGGFIQAVSVFQTDELPRGFTPLAPVDSAFSLDGLIQLMDDCAPHLTFEHVDIYSNKSMRMGKDRLLHQVILPYRLYKASRGFTLYQRSEVTL